MNKFLKFNKRQKLIISIFLLVSGLFASEFLSGAIFLGTSLALSIATVIFLYFILRRDLPKSLFLPVFVLPFLYTFAFSMFYLLVPQRLIFRVVLLIVYAFGLYSLFLTENIFAVSSSRTITLLRSARIVSFIVTLFVLFLLLNIIFSLRLPIFIAPFIIFAIVFLLDYQSLSMNSLDRTNTQEPFFYSLVSGIAVMELSLVLFLWPINASIYSLFLTGIYYTYSGLIHAWIEKRLFKGLLWEYVWVGFLSILILFLFAQWGI